MFKSSLTWRRCFPTKHLTKFLLEVTFLHKGTVPNFYFLYLLYQHFFSFFPKEKGLSDVWSFHWQKEVKA